MNWISFSNIPYDIGFSSKSQELDGILKSSSFEISEKVDERKVVKKENEMSENEKDDEGEEEDEDEEVEEIENGENTNSSMIKKLQQFIRDIKGFIYIYIYIYICIFFLKKKNSIVNEKSKLLENLKEKNL